MINRSLRLLCCALPLLWLWANPASATPTSAPSATTAVANSAATDSATTTAAPARHPALALIGGNFASRKQAAQALADSNAPRASHILEALVAGQLYGDADNGLLVIKSQGSSHNALTGEALASLPGELRKVVVNNALRGHIRALLAGLSLRHADPEVRRSAALQLMTGAADGRFATIASAQLAVESDAEVKELLQQVLAISTLGSGDQPARLAAVSTLSDSLYPEVRNLLLQLAETDSDDAVKAAAGAALKSIDGRVERFRLLENLFFGLSLGSVLLLAAVGLAITFGVMGVINMAHGELIMLGAYTTYVIQLLLPDQLGLALLLAIPAAFVVSGLVGIAIERGVIRHLYGRPLETLLATFGISLLLQQAVRSIFSPLNRAVASPDWLSGSLQFNPVFAITWNRLYILLFSLLVFAALLLVLKRTTLGIQVRAVAQNRGMARAIGVRANRVDALTFGLGSGIAGIAGVALSQLTNVGPNLGQAYIIDSFMVVVFGGVGNLWGTLVGAFSLGLVNKFLEPWSGAVLAKILLLVAIILFIQKRPRGLFPQKGRAAEG